MAEVSHSGAEPSKLARVPLQIERLDSGSYYITSPRISGLGLVADDLEEAAEDLPWVVERLIWLQDHAAVRARTIGGQHLATVLGGPSPELELLPADTPPGYPLQ